MPDFRRRGICQDAMMLAVDFFSLGERHEYRDHVPHIQESAVA
jgi:hypothetical protein